MILTNVKHVDELIDDLHFASLVKVSDDETLQLDSKGHFGDLRRSYEGANTYMASVTDPAALSRAYPSKRRGRLAVGSA